MTPLPTRRRLSSASRLAAMALVAWVGAVGAQGSSLQWGERQVNVAYQEKPLRDVLRELFAQMRVPVVVSEQIDDKVTGRFRSSAESFFTDLTSVFGLIWYYDGAVLYVNDPSEATSRILYIGPRSKDRFLQSLREMNLLDPRYTLHVRDEEGIVHVSGPPRYVDVVESVADRIANSRARTQVASSARPVVQQNPAEQYTSLAATFRAFPLRYGWAQDTTMSVGGREVVVPGVASTLRRLVGNYTHGASVDESIRSTGARRSSGLDRLRDRRGALDAPLLVRAEGVARLGGAFAGSSGAVNVSLPRIEADARTNTVIVHDLAERMGQYDELVATLDRRTTMIEIEATILDVATDSLKRLGVDFSQGGVSVVVGDGDGVSGQAVRSTALETTRRIAGGFVGPLGTPAGLTTVVGNMGRLFLAQVNLLASEGNAYVYAQPSVLTMDNSEAVLENTETFFVRVAGREDVDLFDITSGTILRVTPVAIDSPDGGPRHVKLAVRIEDGSITGRLVDDIPIVKRTNIGTQALIREGESLLIGGYSYNIDNDLTRKIPVLGDIPALGALFTFKAREVRRVERMFMITPRLVPQ